MYKILVEVIFVFRGIMKYIIFSVDDGTVFDARMVELMNKYHIKGTFNLNSGLDDFVWYYNNEIKIPRLRLNDFIWLYEGHEISSHSLTHPHLDDLDYENLLKEVYEDKNRLEFIFKRKISGFATPFDTYNENVINVVRGADFKYCRLPKKTDSFIHNEDRHHIEVNAISEEDDLIKVIDELVNDKNDNSLCIIATHSYEYYVNNSWDYLEKVFAYVNKNNIKSIKTEEALELFFK